DGLVHQLTLDGELWTDQEIMVSGAESKLRTAPFIVNGVGHSNQAFEIDKAHRLVELEFANDSWSATIID
ncbi:MAG: hypothetical protein AAGD96_08745, partial [Chloroflexota bacterium]